MGEGPATCQKPSGPKVRLGKGTSAQVSPGLSSAPSPPPRQRGALHLPGAKVTAPAAPVPAPPKAPRRGSDRKRQHLPERPGPGGASPASPLRPACRAGSCHPLKESRPRCSCHRKSEVSPIFLGKVMGMESQTD